MRDNTVWVPPRAAASIKVSAPFSWTVDGLDSSADISEKVIIVLKERFVKAHPHTCRVRLIIMLAFGLGLGFLLVRGC
jgi:hypothetical protein